MLIDTTFDFRTDAGGKDPDTYSATLCRYHRFLWSKPLPGGVTFELVPTSRPPYYFSHNSTVGDFVLSSDAFIPAYTRYGVPKSVLEQVSTAEHDHFNAIGYTIGGLILWPAVRIDGKWTINQARGCLRSIADRMDLTLESIRCHYRGEWSPLANVLARYRDFFAAFDDSSGATWTSGCCRTWSPTTTPRSDSSCHSTSSEHRRFLRTSTPTGSTGAAASSSSKHATAGSSDSRPHRDSRLTRLRDRSSGAARRV
jgi:hypothetical protein